MGRKKNVSINDDEYDLPQDDDAAADQAPPAPPPKTKKGGVGKGKPKGAGGFAALADEDEIESKDEDDAGAEVVFSGKKKPSKGKKGGGGFSAFNLLADDDDAGQDDVSEEADEVLVFTGKKKHSKSKKGGGGGGGKGFSALGEEEEDAEEEVKQKEKTGKVEEVILNGDGEDDADAISDMMVFSGKKKSSKSKKGGSGSAATSGGFSAFGSLVQDYDELKLKGEGVAEDTVRNVGGADDANAVKVVPLESALQEETTGPKKQQQSKKKKKNKSGRTAQEEEDLDKLLAELGEGLADPPAPTPAAAPAVADASILEKEVVGTSDQVDAEEKEGEADSMESAAAKKKKKKKEKEKEKKAAAAASAAATAELKDDAKGKILDKKIPKHVREMQEALARRKEEEERKKKEEEERLRKEEEERKRQEEAARLAEEAKKRKKEREKEKLQQKKKEGKLLTGKQKEEARRREIMRNQFLAAAGEVPSAGADSVSEVKKKPIYKTKKSRPTPAKQETIEDQQEVQPNLMEPEMDQVEEDVSIMEESTSQVGESEDTIREKQEVLAEAVEEDDVDEDWDAKSWDDVDVILPPISAFGEEDEEDAEPAVKQPTERAAQLPCVPLKGEPMEIKQNDRKTDYVSRANSTKGDPEYKDSKFLVNSDKQSGDNLRSPICCILGHVDTGKTKLLDSIRGTNVQEGEAGGITQQIGATYFPTENIRQRTKELKADAKLNVPGLLVIDTPGHESFTNLRSRGSSLCDIAILVVDIMHGLEPQTIESLNLLKNRKAKFIVALNKVDRIYGWKKCLNSPLRNALKQQSKDVQDRYDDLVNKVITEFKEQGMNTELYYKNKELYLRNKDTDETFSIVPTSAISGEGIPDLLLLLVQFAQKTMEDKLTFTDEFECTVLEVKVIEGLGTTIDVVLASGILHEGDQIVVCGMQGPIVTNIRALLTPHPMKELRVKGSYVHHKEIKAAQGVKITAQGLEHAVAGTSLYVVGPEDDVEVVKEAAMKDMDSVMSRIDKSGEGVCVQASTIGSLEALLEFLKSPAVRIPVSGISIGPVHKKDVMKASVMLEKKKEYATILAFDVKVTPEVQQLADESGVKIFVADIIYHLFDQFKAYIDNLKEERKKESAEEAVFPCHLKILPNCVFRKKDPIVLGVKVIQGNLRVGTPICIPSRDFIDIGKISSIERDHKQVDMAKKGQDVAIKIVGSNAEEEQKMFGRHFEIEDELYSHITRRSIDILKANYRDDLSLEEWQLVVKLKKLFSIT